MEIGLSRLLDTGDVQGQILVSRDRRPLYWGRRIPHPARKTLAESRILFLRSVRELGLDLVTSDDLRPPRQY